MPSASFSSSRSYVRRSRRKNGNRIPLPRTAEPCDLPCPTANQIIPVVVGGGGGGSGARGSSPSVSGVAAPSPSPQSHSSPYDLRRKSPPHPDPAPGTSSALPPSGGIAATFGSSSLPARKRPRRTCSLSTDGINTNTAAHYLQYELPDEVLLTIFNYLMEQDLCRVSQVCKRFQVIANDTELWKSLYQQVYEYDLPLFNPGPCKFEFVSPDETEYQNPWKESFRQLYRGVHVRPGFQDLKFKGRNLPYFNTVQGALDYVDEYRSNSASVNSGATTASGQGCCNSTSQTSGEDTSTQHLVFLHAGTYRGEFLVIDSDVALIGAAPGNVAESVISQISHLLSTRIFWPARNGI